MGKETIVPRDKLSFVKGVEPHLLCPLHQCVVPLGVVPKEERDLQWAKWDGTKTSLPVAGQKPA